MSKLALLLVFAALACAPPRQQGLPPAADPSPEPAPAESPAPATLTPAQAAARISSSISFAGFGPSPFGSSEEAVRQAWGSGLEGDPAAAGSDCHYLFFRGEMGAPYRLAFMIEGGRFARLDVNHADYLAPGGGRIGMMAGDIRRLYGGRLEERPHKYVEGGKYLIVAPEDGGAARLVFETDAAGAVGEWRIGLEPQVEWVEGCS